MMAGDYEVLPSSPRRRVKQSISVPFQWEEKPGTPKREWAITKPTPRIIPPSPAKLIVSIPFLWEEKPGKPFSGLIMHESSNSSDDSSNYHEDWYLPETDDMAMDLYCSKTPNMGLELLFPLAVPKSGFLNKVHWEDEVVAVSKEDLSSGNKNWRQEGGMVVKRTLTLGELMLMSRRLSHSGKAVNTKKNKFFLDFIKDLLPSCFYLKMNEHPIDVKA